MRSQRIRQTVFAIVVAALHVAAFNALRGLHPASPPLSAAQPPLTVITLPPLPGTTAASGGALSAPPLAITAPLPVPALPALPAITAGTPDPAAAVLGQYLGCHLQNGPQLTEDKERCAKFMRDLPVGPALPPTEEEKRLAQKFDHAQKALESPTAIPCLMGGIQILCVVSTLMTGGDFITTYADLPTRKTDPVATGMVGLSGKTPGSP